MAYGDIFLVEVEKAPEVIEELDLCVLAEGEVMGYLPLIKNPSSATIYVEKKTGNHYLRTVTKTFLTNRKNLTSILPARKIFQIIQQVG